MLNYWIFEVDKNITYSVDMLRFEFTLSDSNMMNVLRFMTSPERTDIVDYGITISDYKYRYMFNINYKNSSMTVGLSLNGSSAADNLKCFCELNPNKVFPEALDDLYFLIDMSMKFRISRWDLAMDFPVARHLVQLAKDQKKYTLIQKSADDKTEYLGSRNKGGFVKLYNKMIESKLDEEITRLEVTCSKDMGLDSIMGSLPDVLISKAQLELCFDDKLSDKDRLFVDLLRMHPDMFSRLDRRNKKKFRDYIFGQEDKLRFSRFSIKKLLDRIKLLEK